MRSRRSDGEAQNVFAAFLGGWMVSNRRERLFAPSPLPDGARQHSWSLARSRGEIGGATLIRGEPVDQSFVPRGYTPLRTIVDPSTLASTPRS